MNLPADPNDASPAVPQTDSSAQSAGTHSSSNYHPAENGRVPGVHVGFFGRRVPAAPSGVLGRLPSLGGGGVLAAAVATGLNPAPPVPWKERR